jgi:hypothetical protein
MPSKQLKSRLATTQAEVVESPKESGAAAVPGETPVSDQNGQIAALAYELWLQRGCPFGSPEEDWFRAEDEIKNHKPLTATAA